MNFFKNLQNFAKDIDPEQIQQVASFVAPHAKKFLSKNKDEEGVEADEGGGAVNFATKLGLSENAAGFLDKFVPDGVDVTEIIQMALSGLDWGALFTPDTVEDCDGFDPEYFGEEEGEEEQDLGAEDEEDPADWEEEVDEDPSDDGPFEDRRFQRKNNTYDGRDVDWTAPENPAFVIDGMSINDIKQNAIGDCWFL